MSLENLVGMLGYIKNNDANKANAAAIQKCHFISTVTLSDGTYSKTLNIAWVDTWYVAQATQVTTTVSNIEF